MVQLGLYLTKLFVANPQMQHQTKMLDRGKFRFPKDEILMEYLKENIARMNCINLCPEK